MLLQAGQSWRVVTLRTAGVLLIALALVMAFASPGIGIVLIGLPSVAVGVWTLALRPLARPLAILAGLAYGAIIGFVATTPLRGLTPPAGQSRDPLDPATVALAVGFWPLPGWPRSASPERDRRQMLWTVEMRYLWLAFAFALLAGCSSTPEPTAPPTPTTSPTPPALPTPTVAMISCQPFGYAPVPVSFSFTPGPVTASAAEQTAVALFQGSAPSASDQPTALVTNMVVTSNAAIGEPSGPNAGQPVWRVQIDVTLGEPAHSYSWTEVNQATGVPTIVALG